MAIYTVQSPVYGSGWNFASQIRFGIKTLLGHAVNVRKVDSYYNNKTNLISLLLRFEVLHITDQFFLH